MSQNWNFNRQIQKKSAFALFSISGMTVKTLFNSLPTGDTFFIPYPISKSQGENHDPAANP
nr:MAG TPA: hypothetical protein [Caudoviricetes sp.]